MLAILRCIALVLIATVLLLPIYWLIMSSFRPAGDIFRYAGQFSLETLVPQRLTLENYQQIFAASLPARAVQLAVRQLRHRGARRPRQLDGGIRLRGVRLSVQEGAVRRRAAVLHDAVRVDRHPALHADAHLALDRHLCGADPARGRRRADHLPVPAVLRSASRRRSTRPRASTARAGGGSICR